MPDEHARTGIAHHFFDSLSHVRLVAVYRALGTPRFIVPERTFFKAHAGVFQKFAAFGAQPRFPAMVSTAEDPNHRFKRPVFRGQAWMIVGHDR